MTIEIPLLPEEEARLRSSAAAAQKELLTFIREAVLEKLDRPSLDELLAPVHQDVSKSGVSESELDAVIEQARDEVWQEREILRMSAERPRVIFDCNVLLQGILNPDGPAGACLQLVKNHHVTLLLSLETLSETRAVLKRPAVQRIAPHLTQERIDRILMEVTYIANLIRDVATVFAFPRDPKDQPYLNLAIAGESHFLVTRDNDLLDLVNDHSAEAKQFRQLTSNRLRIVEPAEFLNAIRAAGNV